MNYRKACKELFPHIEVIRDFSTERLYPDLSLEERAMMSQAELKEIEKEEQEDFAKSRRSDCYGGSDIACIFGKGFTPPSVLARKKQGKYKEIISPQTQELFDTGHRAEPMIRNAFERVSGIRAIEWPLQMRNPKYPHFLMNIDGLVFENGKVGVYEGKWSNNLKVYIPHYKKMKEYRDAGIEPNILTAPEKYLFQVWGYLAGLELDFAYLCGGWGYSDEEIGYVRIPRLPKDKEEYMMQFCEDWMEFVNAGGIPSDRDVKSKVALEKIYADFHTSFEISSKVMKFPRKEEESLKKILELETEVEKIEKSIKKEVDAFKKGLVEQSRLKEKQEALASLRTYFEEQMKGSTTGVLESESRIYNIDYMRKKGRSRTFDKELCKAKYPGVYNEVYTLKEGKKALSITYREK